MSRKAFFLSVLLLAGSTAFAQTYKATHLSLPDGLSQSSVMDMVQDKSGFIWMSTQDGLNRYDGLGFTVFREEPFDSTSISANNLGPLLVDSKGRLWIGTINNGLNLYDEESGNFIHFKSGNHHGDISGNLITAMAEDGAGGLWVGTSNGLNHVVETKDKNAASKFVFDHIPLASFSGDTSLLKYIHDIHFTHDNKIWIATQDGMFRLDLQKPLLPQPSLEVFNIEKKNLSDDLVWCVSGDNEGNIWAGTRKGVDIINRSDGKLISSFTTSNSNISSNLVHKLMCSTAGDMWIGYLDHGVQVVKSGTIEKLRSSDLIFEFPEISGTTSLITSGRTMSLMEDGITPGMIWTGFTAGGALKFVPVTKKFYTDRLEKCGVSNPFITSVLKDKDGYVWVGTTDGLIRHDRKNKKYIRIPVIGGNYDPKENYYISGLAADTSGNVFFSTGMAIFKIVDGSSAFPRSEIIPLPESGEHGFIRTVFSGPKGNVYVLTRFGLYKIDNSQNSVSLLMAEENTQRREDRAFYFSTLYIGDDGAFWIGTSTGLLYYPPVKANGLPDFKNPVVYTHDPADTTSLRNHNILSIDADRNGHIWIGTFNGLSRVVGKGNYARFRNYSTHDGLKNNMVYCILEDVYKGTLWLSTNNGLTEFDPMAGAAVATYDVHDGLQSNEFNSYAAFQASDGELFFGGIDGYSSFYPGQIVKDKTIPKVVVTSILVNGSQAVNLAGLGKQNKIISLPYKDNSFTIEFMGLHYGDPMQNQYLYKLEGLEEGWISTGTTPRVNFSQLSPGEYKFLVKASNSDGIFGDEAESFTIIVKPPFYMTIWFYLIAASFVVMVLWGLHKYRLSLKMEQMKEIDKIRKATAADFHDELGHKLTIINWFAQILKKKIGPEQTDLRPHLDKIIETSGTLYHTMKDMLWAMDPDKDSVYDIYNQLCEFGQELFDSTGVTFESDNIPDELRDKLLSPAHKRHVLLIFKEVMNNSLKHSHGTSTHLSLKKEDKKVRFTFRDDGKGFVMNGHNVGNGLNNVKRRAKLIDAVININNDNSGTIAELEIPV